MSDEPIPDEEPESEAEEITLDVQDSYVGLTAPH
jgi:hypothetical protein